MPELLQILRVLLTNGVNLGGGAVNLFNRIGTGQGIHGMIERYIDNLTDTISHYRSIDAESAKYVQALGGGAKALQTLSNTTLKAAHDLEISKKYNISTEDLIKAQAAYASAIGRNVHVFMGQRDEEGNLIEGTSDMENLAAMTKVFGEATTPLLEGMDLFGISIDSASKRAAKMHNDATKAGISFSKYSDNIVKNFALAQKYTFRDGLRGLESMAKKATELKLDMSQAAAFADNVGSVEKSVSVASKLQVLGGPFAQFADPLGMLNESLNDMEGLQDRMVAMFKDLGTFNQRTGEIEFGAFERRQIKEAAGAMGIDYGNIMTMIQTSTRRDEIKRQLEGTVGSGGMSSDFKELLMNIGTFRDGRAVVTDGDKEYTLDELANNQNLQEELMSKYQDEGQDIKDIASSVRSIDDVIKGFVGQMNVGQAWGEAAKVFKEGGNTTVQNVMDFLTRGIEAAGISANALGESTAMLKHYYEYVMELVGEKAGQAIQIIPDVIDKISDILNNVTQWVGDIVGVEVPEWGKTGSGMDVGKNGGIGGYSFSTGGQQFNPPERPPEQMGEGGDAIIPQKEFGGFVESPYISNFKTGGSIFGKSHKEGGEIIEAERGEFVVNKEAMKEFGPVVEQINNYGLRKFEFGGYTGDKVGNLDFKDNIFNLDDTNSSLLRDMDVNIRAINESIKVGIKPLSTNSIDTYRVKPVDDNTTFKSKLSGSDKPLDINLNIKLSDLNVKGDGSKTINMQDLLSDNRFEKAVKEMIIDAITKGNDSEKVDKQRSA